MGCTQPNRWLVHEVGEKLPGSLNNLLSLHPILVGTGHAPWATCGVGVLSPDIHPRARHLKLDDDADWLLALLPDQLHEIIVHLCVW